MLETCRGGPGPISLSVENFDQVRHPGCWPKTKFLIKFDHPGPVGQSEPNPVLLATMDQIFDQPIFPLFDAL